MLGLSLVLIIFAFKLHVRLHMVEWNRLCNINNMEKSEAPKKMKLSKLENVQAKPSSLTVCSNNIYCILTAGRLCGQRAVCLERLNVYIFASVFPLKMAL